MFKAVTISRDDPPPLSVRDLRMVYGAGAPALDGVSLDVGRDDFLVVLGPSGAGKSTLLRLLNRLGTPTGGHVYFQGLDVTRAAGGRLRALRQSVGMVFQQFNLVGRLNVLQNVLCGRLRFATGPWRGVLSHARWFSAADRAIALHALERVGVAHLAERRADSLSGGQQQRVAIARALAQEPTVMLADEPIASLDPRSAERVMEILREIHRERALPVVVNLHQVDVALKYATRIVGMRAGRVVFDGPARDLTPGLAASLYHAEPTRRETERSSAAASISLVNGPLLGSHP